MIRKNRSSTHNNRSNIPPAPYQGITTQWIVEAQTTCDRIHALVREKKQQLPPLFEQIQKATNLINHHFTKFGLVPNEEKYQEAQATIQAVDSDIQQSKNILEETKNSVQNLEDLYRQNSHHLRRDVRQTMDEGLFYTKKSLLSFEEYLLELAITRLSYTSVCEHWDWLKRFE